MTKIKPTIRAADLSGCERYRFTLVRAITAEPVKTAVFILNNPSVADSRIDDPTSRRGWDYTVTWGFNRMVFVNTNPHRSTNPSLAEIPPEEILLQNDAYITSEAEKAEVVVAAWGSFAVPWMARRAIAAVPQTKPIYALDLTKDGMPRHILYLKASLTPDILIT